MTTTGLREVTDDDLDEALERVLVPRLHAVLASRDAGHCLRVGAVGADLAVRLCRRLRAALGSTAQIHVLGEPPEATEDVAVTGSKLIELRNPDVAGKLRAPLLVFIPPGTQTSAEDSFGVATFEQADLGDVYGDLAGRLLASIPEQLRAGVADLLGAVDDEARARAPAPTSLQRARYLLALARNDHDREAAGAALFELDLVPDFELFSDPVQIRTRATRNCRQMQVLNHADRTLRQRVIDLHLTDPAFRARLADFLVTYGPDGPRAWTRRIVVDRANWGLSFHRWPLPEERPPAVAHITVDDLDLPLAGATPEHASHPVLRNITGQPYLLGGAAGHTQLSVGFEVTPDPRQITGLTAFSVQLVSEESGPTGVRATVRVSTTSRRTYKARLAKLRASHLDEGWHFLRVLPLDADRIPLPVDPGRNQVNGGDHGTSGDSPAGGHPDNESDRFYVVVDEGLDEPPPVPRTGRSVGVSQELRRLQFEALANDRDWAAITCRQATWTGADRSTIEASFGIHGSVEIPLAPALAEVELAILAASTALAQRQILSVSGQPARMMPAEQGPSLPATEPMDAFIQARAAALAAVYGDDGMVLAGRDLRGLRHTALAYAEAYAQLLAHELRAAERAADPDLVRRLAPLLQVDTVRVDHQDPRGRRSAATLVSPTHPLRLLWLVAWAELGYRWLNNAAGGSKAAIAAAARTLLALRPAGFPFVVGGDNGRLSVAAADLTPYWGICLPTDTADPHTLIADVARGLGITERAAADLGITPSQLADRLERYVRMHPYVRTLVVCVVNPGRADHIADTLIELERRPGLRHLNYDVRLFTAGATQPNTGEALAQLLRGEWGTSAEAEAFATPRMAGSTPKLAVSVRPLDDFRSATSRHAAHVTMLFDAFNGEHIEVGPADAEGPASVHGLVQQTSIQYVDEDGTTAWHKQPRFSRRRSEDPPGVPPGTEEYSDLLASLPALICSAAAAMTTGEAGTSLVPRITLSLTADDATLLHQAHRCSDWVITVDRTLGIEYFDSPGSSRRPDYVIDVAAGGASGPGHHLIVSSRSVDELRALLDPMIGQHGLQIDRRHAGTFFEQLRLLSSQLAFKIASTSPNQRTEVLGLALARLYLDQQAVLADQILLPLDSHLELYREARHQADDAAEGLGLQRTDLALFSLDAKRRLITCRLVEVKCHSSLASPTEVQGVRDRIASQLNRTATVLAETFDPQHVQPDRPDRAVHNAELAALLAFYLDRAVRHSTLTAAVAAEGRWLLDHLDDGYELQFTRTGLIFDLGRPGLEHDFDGGIEHHRIGRDRIEDLLGAIGTDPVLAAATHPTAEVSLPRMSDAAFRAPARSHDLPTENAPAPVGEVTPQAAAAVTREVPPSSPSADLAAAEESRVGRPAPSRAVRSPDGLPTAEPPAWLPEIYTGSNVPSPQYGVLGEYGVRRVAVDLNETHTISLFGVQGGGKSYTLGSIVEAASLAAPPLNRLPQPLATIIFHYSSSLDYEPEFVSMISPNTDQEQVAMLHDRYSTAPAALSDVAMLVPADQLAQRQADYPGIAVYPLKFGAGELQAAHWRFLMGAVGNQSAYIRQLGRIIRANRGNLSLDAIRVGIEASSLSDTIKQLAHQRLDFAADYVEDTARIKDLVRPGRVIIVDLRDELIEKDEVLGLFVVIMGLFAESTIDGEHFNLLVVFDEAHKYMGSPDLVSGLVESVREMRHKGLNILVASQDPPSVPISLIELSDHVILHKINSPAWLKHLQKANAALADLTAAKLTSLRPGEAYIWSSRATEAAFTRGAVKVQLRPRLTRHGGDTRTAVEARRDNPRVATETP